MAANTTGPKITRTVLSNWNACDGGMIVFNGLFPRGADARTAIQGLSNAGHENYARWLYLKVKQHRFDPEATADGYRNIGKKNDGEYNTGESNVGDRNTNNQNVGDRNTGWNNKGNNNSDACNVGDFNSGHDNRGDRNSGAYNVGDDNSGEYNVGDNLSGVFNNKPNFFAFNRPCDKDDWDNARKPAFLIFDLTEWVYARDMTNEEKQHNPGYAVRDGFLRVLDYKEAFKKSWDQATPGDRKLVESLPNFDAQVFFEISGIDVRIKPGETYRYVRYHDGKIFINDEEEPTDDVCTRGAIADIEERDRNVQETLREVAEFYEVVDDLEEEDDEDDD